MKQLRKLIIISFMFLLPLFLSAGNSKKCVVLETTEGEKMEFNLSSNPRLVQENDIVILTFDESKVEILMMDIKKIYFSSSNSDGVNRIIGKTEGRIDFLGGSVCLSGFEPGEQIGIYNFAGHQIMRTVITSDGTIIIPFSAIPKGVSIIKSNKQSFKINIK